MIRRILLFAAMLAACVPAFAQDLTTVTAVHIQDGAGNLLPSGTIYFLPVNQQGVVTPFRLGSGGQGEMKAVHCSILAGVITGTCKTPNTATTIPGPICLQTTVKDSAGQLVIFGIGYACVQPTGSTYNFDLFVPNTPPASAIVNNSISGNVAITGNLSATGSISAGELDLQKFEGVRFADQFSGADAGAQINAAIADLPSGGGVIDGRGLIGTQTFSHNVVLASGGGGGSGKRIRLILDPATLFIFNGTGIGFTIDEGCDHCAIEGLNLNLKNNSGTTYGIVVRGAWYARLENMQVRGAPTAGIKLSNDGATNRGTYHAHLINILLGDPPDETLPILAADQNGTGLKIISNFSTGVTMTMLDRVWVTFATGNGIEITAISGTGTVQALGTSMRGGGSSYNGLNGVNLNAGAGGTYGVDFTATGGPPDFEGNGSAGTSGQQWGIQSNANVISVSVDARFSSNPSGNVNPISQSTLVRDSGQSGCWSSSGLDIPTKPCIEINGPSAISANEQRTAPIEFQLPSLPSMREENVKLSTTNGGSELLRWAYSSTNWFGFDGPVGRLMFGSGTASPAQYWNPGSGGTSIQFPSTNDTLVGRTTTDTFTNKTFDTAGAGNQLRVNGVSITDNTGTGRIVHETSPAFISDITVPTVKLNSNVTWTSGLGVPSAGSCTTAKGGSLYSRTDGTTSTSLYVCDSASGVWTAK